MSDGSEEAELYTQEQPQFDKRKLKETVGGRPPSLTRRLRNIILSVAATGGLIIGGKLAYEKMTSPPEYFGEPYGDGIPLVTDLIRVKDNRQELINPTYRSKPVSDGHELSSEELQEKGFQPEIRNGVVIQEVKGGTYPGNPLHGKGRIEENGETFGVWGEILLPKMGEIGQYTRTGIYVSENFIDQENSDKVNLVEGKQPQVFANEGH